MDARKLLYAVGFVGLALTAALAVDRVGSPSIARLLAVAVVVSSVAASPGLVHRRAWPLALLLVPLGALLLLRAQLSLPPTVHGFWQQLGYYHDQLDAGGRAYVTRRLPFDFTGTPELRLLFSMSIYAIVALAAFFALSLRKALPAIVLLLVPLAFGLTVDEVERAVWPPLFFVVLAGCLLMLSRSLGRQRWRLADYLPGVATTLLASLLGLWLLGATSAAASPPWQDWRTWGGSFSGRVDSTVAFNWMEDYPSLLDPADNAEVMKVKSTVAWYWRANGLDYFNGTSWLEANPYEGQMTPRQGVRPTSGAYTYVLPVDPHAPAGELVREGFEITSLFTDYLFSGGAPTTLAVGRELPLYLSAAQGLWLKSPAGPRLDYEVTAVVPRLKPTDLVGRGRVYPPDVFADIGLPFPGLVDVGSKASESTWRQAMEQTGVDRRWFGLFKLNRGIVGRATDPYEIALRVEEYLRQHYTYTLHTPQSATASPYAAFLFTTKRGYCQQFAGSMAVLMRFNGIPARVAVGFTPGREAKHGLFVVSRTDAHAWVEVYFPAVGWVPFDPTPGRSLPGTGPSSTSAGFVDPFAVQNAGAGPGAATAGGQQLRDRTRNSGITGAAGGGSSFSGGISRTLLFLLWVIVIVLAFLAWPAVLLLLRRRATHRGSLDRRLRASLGLMLAELDDYGLTVPRSQTLEETSVLIMRYLDVDATSLVDRVQAVLFGARSATQNDLDDVAVLRRRLRRSLRAHGGWARRLLALYGWRPAAVAGG